MINKKDGRHNPKRRVPTDQYVSHTAEEHYSQSPKITDTPNIYGNLVGKKDVSRVPKHYEKEKLKHQAKG